MKAIPPPQDTKPIEGEFIAAGEPEPLKGSLFNVDFSELEARTRAHIIRNHETMSRNVLYGRPMNHPGAEAPRGFFTFKKDVT